MVSLLTQCFLAVLVSQTILGLCNSLFVLQDNNVTLALFGFYATVHSNRYAYIAVRIHIAQRRTLRPTNI